MPKPVVIKKTKTTTAAAKRSSPPKAKTAIKGGGVVKTSKTSKVSPAAKGSIKTAAKPLPTKSKTAANIKFQTKSTPSTDRRKAIEKFFARRKGPASYAAIATAMGIITTGQNRDSISSPLRTLLRQGFLVRIGTGSYQRADCYVGSSQLVASSRMGSSTQANAEGVI